MSGPGPVTRQDQIDAKLRERQVVAMERQALAPERIADEFKVINRHLMFVSDVIVNTDTLLAQIAEGEPADTTGRPSADVR